MIRYPVTVTPTFGSSKVMVTDFAVIDCPVDYAENAKLTLHLKELMEGK